MASPEVVAAESTPTLAAELGSKLTTVRSALARHRLAGVRLRGQDWFAWATCGGSNRVLLAAESGVADVLITESGAWVLTDEIEAARLRVEQVPPELEVIAVPWAEPWRRDAIVADAIGAGSIASDRPVGAEHPLPAEIVAARLQLLPAEVERMRALGEAAAEALTVTLGRATPEDSELELAAAGADALLRRGIDPALVLVAGTRRLDLYRHPLPTAERIGDRAMVVFCGRRHGLYANLTRFVYFRQPNPEEMRRSRAVAEVESAAWDASQVGATLGGVLTAISAAYARLGYAGAERDHHQGGTTGYRSREEIATLGSTTAIVPGMALAWNPSLSGAKIEDTVLRSADGLEVLTVDPAWPTEEVAGRPRPVARVLA